MRGERLWEEKRNLFNVNDIIYIFCEHEKDINVPALQNKCSASEEIRHQCV